MGKNKKFYLQESDDSNMNRSPIDGIVPYGGFLKDMVYPDFYGPSMFAVDMPQMTNSQASQLKSNVDSDSQNLTK